MLLMLLIIILISRIKVNSIEMDWTAVASFAMVFITSIALIINQYQWKQERKERNEEQENLKKQWNIERKQWIQEGKLRKEEQLFDKRYSVYKTLIDAKRCANFNDFKYTLLFDVINFDDIKQKMYECNENIKEKTSLSQIVFNEKIYVKMKKISELYQNVFDTFIGWSSRGFDDMMSIEQKKVDKKIYYHNYINNYGQPDFKFSAYEYMPLVLQCSKNIDDDSLNFAKIQQIWAKHLKEFNNEFENSCIIDDINEYIRI